MLAFIVPESPTLGIEKKTFNRCLDLIDKYFYERLTPELDAGSKPTGRRVLHIVAPCFDASQWSLEASFSGWHNRKDQSYYFRVISNNASRIEQDRLQKIFSAGKDRHKLNFRSMVHKAETVQEQMLMYLKDQLDYDHTKLAILIESNPGLQQATANRILEQSLAEDFIFPLQVSEIRKAYAKEGLLHGGKLDSAGAPERLAIPPDEAGVPGDLPRSFTPASSAALDEMALTQMLTTIGHRRYQAVGIIASNPLDIIFLARQVRRFCPNVRLFTTQADLLFARPQNVADLRGMLVASTYSLYPPNQWIITSYGAKPHVQFSDQGAHGLYNAVVAHLWEMGIATDPHAPQLLELPPPYQEAPETIGPDVFDQRRRRTRALPLAEHEGPEGRRLSV